MLPNLDRSLREVDTMLTQLKTADVTKSSNLDVFAKQNSMKKSFDNTKKKLSKFSEQTRQFDIIDEINLELEAIEQFVTSSKQSVTSSSQAINDSEDVKSLEQKYAVGLFTIFFTLLVPCLPESWCRAGFFNLLQIQTNNHKPIGCPFLF